MQLTTPFIIKPDGKAYYEYCGVLIPQALFEEIFPIEKTEKKSTKFNPCKKYEYLHDRKSY